MKKTTSTLLVLSIFLICSVAKAQFRIYNSELLKIGNVLETPYITKGFEASMSQLLFKSGSMGLNNTASIMQLGQLDTRYNVRSGIKIYSDTIKISSIEGGVKIFLYRPVNPIQRVSGTTMPGVGGLGPSTLEYDYSAKIKMVGFGKKLIVGELNNELDGVFSQYYYSSTSSGIKILSDVRYKTNIQSMESSIGKIKQLRPVRFDYVKMDSLQEKVVDPTRSNRVGFIAQELLNVCPEAVGYDETNDIYTVDYSVLIPFLVKALQEQQAEIEALKNLIR